MKKAKMTKVSMDLVDNFSSVVVSVEIPISLRMGDGYDAHCGVVNKMASGGQITGGGCGLRRSCYDHSISFDAYKDGTVNERNAVAFIKAYKKKFPRHKVVGVTVTRMGYRKSYGSEIAEKYRSGSVDKFIKEVA